MPDLPLSKYLDPADFDQLGEELVIVDRWFTSAREQHPMRRWEYAMALRARRDWLQWDYEQHGHANRAHGHLIKDVGGAGSPFAAIVSEDAGQPVGVIDPDQDPGLSLAQYLRWRGQLAHEVYCLSVLEHVEDLDQFLYHLSCLTAPGGLLFLTFDTCGPHATYSAGEVLDTYHFNWMRRRIFSQANYESLAGIPTWASDQWPNLTRYGFSLLGDGQFPTGADYPGPQVYDYTFASLALQKRI